MALEIEHKFLVVSDEWRRSVRKSSSFRQGYLNNNELQCSIRVRTSQDRGWLNVKSATIGIERQEFEYEIPLKDANTMLESLARKPLIEKTRHIVDFGEHAWEIDVFEGENKGLVVAEIELATLGEPFSKPSWVGEDVSHDIRYYNTSLSKRPYDKW